MQALEGKMPEPDTPVAEHTSEEPVATLDTASHSAPDEIDPPAFVREPATQEVTAAQASELTELFFAADATERALILQNLAFAPIAPAAPLHVGHARDAARRLEVAALARSSFEFATILVNTLGVSQALATRIVLDPSGEPLIVAARALDIPADILQRIILFLNPAIGQSVQRVYDLVHLYDDVTADTARRLVSIWRATSAAIAKPRHQAAMYDDEPYRARTEAAADTHRAAPRPAERARRGNIA
jgi:hypothetical protein